MANAHYQNTRLSEEDAEATATYYVNKLDVHNVEKKFIYDHDDDEEYRSYTFQVKIGKPTFRGTVNYALPEHSLSFNTLHPTQVLIVHNEKLPEWCNAIIYGLRGMDNNRFRYVNDNSDYSLHPHISVQGEPCLGGWARAWSACVSTGNIVSLIPVAKSFLNTWTRNDAYWDINNVYSIYRRIPMSIKKHFDKNDYFTAYQYWVQMIQVCDIPRPRYYNDFGSWCTTNEHLVLDLILHKGLNPVKLYIVFKAVEANSRVKSDTYNKEKKRIFDGQWIVRDLVDQTMVKISKVIRGPNHSAFTTPIVAETVINARGHYIKTLWSQTSDTWFNELHRLTDYINTSIDRDIRTRQNSHRADVDVASLFGFMRHCKARKKYSADVYLESQDIENAIYYYVNRMSEMTGPQMLDAFKAVCKYLDVKATISGQGLGDNRKISQTLHVLLLELDSWKQNMEPNLYQEKIDEISDHLVNESLDRIERMAVNLVTEKIQNGKSKHKRVPVESNSVRNDAQQSQLFAEAF